MYPPATRQQQYHHTTAPNMVTQKHWLLQSPAEIAANISAKEEKHFAILQTNIYFFCSEHVLLIRQRDPPSGREEEWIVPRDIERVDRPASHPTQEIAASIPLRNRVLSSLNRMRVPPNVLHQTQFMEHIWRENEPLYLPDGENLTIWVILTGPSLSPESREVLLTTLNNSAKYRWASASDISTNVKTPGTDHERTEQLHILDLKNAFLRLHLCVKDSILLPPSNPSRLPSICKEMLASLLEARGMCFQGDAGRYGMIMLSSKHQPRHLMIQNLGKEQMDTKQWPKAMNGQSGEVYHLVGGFSKGGQLQVSGNLPWAELMEAGGRIGVVWGK